MDPILLTAIVALPAGFISYAALRAARSARRNRDDQCGNCGGPLYAPGSHAGPSLLQGHLVCASCATKERRSLRSSLIAAAALTGGAVLALAAVAIWAPGQLGSHPWLPAAATALTYPVMFGGVITYMKRLNRRAAQRLGLDPGSSGLSTPGSSPALSTGARRLLQANGPTPRCFRVSPRSLRRVGGAPARLAASSRRRWPHDGDGLCS